MQKWEEGTQGYWSNPWNQMHKRVNLSLDFKLEQALCCDDTGLSCLSGYYNTKSQYSMYDYSTSLLLRTINFTKYKVVSSIASILQKINWSFYKNLDNIGNLLTICYVLVMCTFVRRKTKRRREKKGRERRWKYRLVSASVGGHTSTGLTKASDQVISSSLDIYWSSWPNLNLHYIWKQRRRKKN